MIKVASATVCAFLFIAGPALASVTVSNQDVKSHTLVVNRGTKGESNQDIAAGKSSQLDCPEDCGLRVESSPYSRIAGGNSSLVIDHEGELHFVGGQGDMTMPNGKN